MGSNAVDISSKVTKVLKTTSTNAKLPSNIGFFEDNSQIEIVLKEKAIGLSSKNDNMQQDGAAFEAWAFILKNYYLKEDKKIAITADEAADFPEAFSPGKKSGHYGRFLYRVIRFCEQYEWFMVKPGSKLEKAVNQFSSFMSENILVGNKSGGNGNEENDRLEHIVEGVFARDADLLRKCASTEKFDIGDNAVYRQLAVGLFCNSVTANNRVFTGGKSAIDLWTLTSGDAVSIFELKANNTMAGIITETMFYANYIRDMFLISGNSFQPSNPSRSGNSRGYKELYEASQNNKLKKVYAYFLTDALHSLINDEVIKLMNANNGTPIEYGSIQYDLCLTVGEYK